MKSKTKTELEVMKMDPEVKKLWVKALESGKYKQGRNTLRFKDKYCCLGVLCDLHGKHAKSELKKWSEPDIGVMTYGPGGQTDSLPPEVSEWAGIPGEDNPRLILRDELKAATSLNDIHELTFKQIAALVKDQL